MGTQKLSLSQSLQQKLSPQQIQLIKLLQVPAIELNERIQQELEINPALEEGSTEETKTDEADSESDANEELPSDDYEYLQDDYAGYKMQGNSYNSDFEHKERPIQTKNSLNDLLITQLEYLKIDEREMLIGLQLIGSIEVDGYLHRKLEAIVNDLAILSGINAQVTEVEGLLKKIQQFDPPGIGARNLQECLTIQLDREESSNPTIDLSKQIIGRCFGDFSKKNYKRIRQKLKIDNDTLLKAALDHIIRLDPKPGYEMAETGSNPYLFPDFILTNDNGKLELSLQKDNAPNLHVSNTYQGMFQSYHHSPKKTKKMKETMTFIKQKIEAANWFIDAIEQRKKTLLNTMNEIVKYQYSYFLTGDDEQLKPMIMKNIAEKINMDISTISRIANSKSIQTDFGIFPIRRFFSEGILTDVGENVSSHEVKSKLKTLIEKEDKKRPLPDSLLEEGLKEMGYLIARRTVSKYREQLKIPVARLRKKM